MKLNLDVLILACRKLRKDAEIVRSYGGDQVAVALESCADIFEIAIDEWLDETLSPTQAGLEGPLSAATVAKHVREGRLPQAGRRGTPLVRRRDLLGIPNASDTSDVIRLIVRGEPDALDPNDPFPFHA